MVAESINKNIFYASDVNYIYLKTLQHAFLVSIQLVPTFSTSRQPNLRQLVNEEKSTDF